MKVEPLDSARPHSEFDRWNVYLSSIPPPLGEVVDPGLEPGETKGRGA